MENTDELAMLFAGREAACGTVLRFMRVALQQALQTLQAVEQPPAIRQSGGHAPFGSVLREQYQLFRSAHLAPPPGLAMPTDPAKAEGLRQAYARAYREQFDRLHKQLVAEMPELGPPPSGAS